MTRHRRSREIVCQQLVELVTAYLEGDLDPVDRAAVEAHLAVCQHCTAYLQQVRRILALTAETDPRPVPAALLDALTAAYRARS